MSANAGLSHIYPVYLPWPQKPASLKNPWSWQEEWLIKEAGFPLEAEPQAFGAPRRPCRVHLPGKPEVAELPRSRSFAFRGRGGVVFWGCMAGMPLLAHVGRENSLRRPFCAIGTNQVLRLY